MRASIIIVTYGQRELTEQCLRSLESCLGERLGVDWELVVIDNNSPDDTPELLRAWSEKATVRLLDKNRNFAGGCNDGAALARGEVLVFLNSDTVVTPGALETIVEQALEPEVAVAGCRLLFPDGTCQHAGVAFIRGTALGGAAMGQHIFHHQDQGIAATQAVYECDCVTAACMAVRAETFRAVGGFDELYRNGLEDVDLCLRIRMTGARIVYRGDVTITHHEGASRGQGKALFATPAKREAMRHNDSRFASRWAAELDQDDELARRVWDAELQNQAPVRTSRTANLVIAGQPSGIGPAADEARAFLSVLSAHGWVVATGESPHPTVVPRLSGEPAALLADARRRAPREEGSVGWLFVPTGAHDDHSIPDGAIVRLAQPRASLPLEHAGAIWACSPAVANAIVAEGLSPAQVSVVPPPVAAAPLGRGGAGVLAVLPTHDRAATRRVLDALARIPSGVHIRLLPVVWTRGVEQEIRERLPRAELLGPCSDEARFAALAADADVVLAADPSDRFERPALVAAGVGAAPVTLSPDGPAASVLGSWVAAEQDSLADVLAARLAEPGDRAARAQRVHEECGAGALPRHLGVGSGASAIAA